MNDLHPSLFLIDPNTRLMMEDSVHEAKKHRLYQSIIGSCMYLEPVQDPISHIPSLTCRNSLPPRPSLTIQLPNVYYGTLKVPKDVKLSIPRSDTSEITLEECSESGYNNACLVRPESTQYQLQYKQTIIYCDKQ
jgi:hypothetical protein